MSSQPPLLQDVVEDTGVTEQDLLACGYQAQV